MIERLPLAWIATNRDLLMAQRRSLHAVQAAGHRRYQARRRVIDPQFKLLSNLRCRLASAIRRMAKGSTKFPVLHLIGCSLPELKSHLEAKFLPGMSWSNYGAWHVDHIRPCAAFDLADP